MNLARLVWRLARAPSLIWILLTMTVSLLAELLELLVPILETIASEAASLGFDGQSSITDLDFADDDSLSPC